MFGSIHQDLINLGRSYEECAGMGATLSLCWITPGWMYFGHIGDSRIYYLPKNGKFAQITQDHNHVGWLRRNGKINEREARDHPLRSSLNQSLGSRQQFVEPQIGAVGYQVGDRFLICSDGLIDGLWDRRIEEILRSDTPTYDLARLYVREAIENSGRDNTTAVVIDIRARPEPGGE
jgi:protein phosphatase